MTAGFGVFRAVLTFWMLAQVFPGLSFKKLATGGSGEASLKVLQSIYMHVFCSLVGIIFFRLTCCLQSSSNSM